MVESNPTPTIPITNPCPPYALRSGSSQPAPPPPAYNRSSVLSELCAISDKEKGAAVTSSRKHQRSQPAPPPASSGGRRKAAVVTSTRKRGSKGSLGVRAAVVSSASGGGNNRSKAVTSSRRGGKSQQPDDPERERQLQESEAKLRAYEERKKKEALAYLPTFVAAQAGEPAQLAIEYYKEEVGVQLRLVEMIHASSSVTSVGLITHLQFKALPLNSSGEPSGEPPTTVYAQIHKAARFSCTKKAHATRVFTPESPLLKDPLFKVHPDKGWIAYPYDCPKCGLDFNNDREMFENIRPSVWI